MVSTGSTDWKVGRIDRVGNVGNVGAVRWVCSKVRVKGKGSGKGAWGVSISDSQICKNPKFASVSIR